MKVLHSVFGAALGLAAMLWQTPAGAAEARRVVAAGGALTEIVYSLGLADRLVGVDTTSLYPAATSELPKIGYVRSLGAEGVLSLRPDLLLAAPEAGPPAVLDQVRAAGVRVETVAAANSPDGVAQKLRAVSAALGRPGAGDALERDFQARWRAAREEIAGHGDRPRVLFVLAHTGGSPLVAGRNTAADAVIALAGGDNAGAGFDGYKPMSAEAVMLANPEVLLITTQGIQELGGLEPLWDNTALRQTPAGRARRAVAMDALYLLGFGPRLPEAMADLARRIRNPKAG
jgi:iron complex transport system substrate-binding protein